MVKCALKTCKNNSFKQRKKDGVSYFKFPCNPTQREKWRKIVAIERGDEFYKPNDSSVICSDHFSDTDTYYCANGMKMKKKGAVPRLNFSSCPSTSTSEGMQPITSIPDSIQTSAVIDTMTPIIIVHGGAGDIAQSRVQGKLDGVRLAVREGYRVLQHNGSALDAVEAAVVTMELDENFNAGYGSVLNLAGEVEMEASIMSGENLDVGAVTLIKDFLHPISIAHKVLTDSPHSLIGGEGAKQFALDKGFLTVPQNMLVSANAEAALKEFLENGGEFGKTEIGVAEGGVGTVGAVAIDVDGHIAVATSTGGMTGKVVGRIGDTPQIGSGTYADDNIGGVSSTGHGESILKVCLAHSIIKLMESGVDADTATKQAVTAMTSRLKNTAGAITLSKKGEVGVYFSSKRMSWAYIKDEKLFYGIEQGEVLEENYVK